MMQSDKVWPSRVVVWVVDPGGSKGMRSQLLLPADGMANPAIPTSVLSSPGRNTAKKLQFCSTFTSLNPLQAGQKAEREVLVQSQTQFQQGSYETLR